MTTRRAYLSWMEMMRWLKKHPSSKAAFVTMDGTYTITFQVRRETPVDATCVIWVDYEVE